MFGKLIRSVYAFPQAMTEENDNHKDVFAHFGLAAYYAQCFEMEIKNIFMLSIRANHRTLPPDFFEQCEAALDQQTLGTLVRDIRKVVSFDEGCASAVATALSNRNRLMHGFYERHAIDMLSHHGRDAAIAELETYTETFKVADAVGRSVSGALCKVLGISEQLLAAELKRMKQQAASSKRGED
jgi:hypothetical protein